MEASPARSQGREAGGSFQGFDWNTETIYSPYLAKPILKNQARISRVAATA